MRWQLKVRLYALGSLALFSLAGCSPAANPPGIDRMLSSRDLVTSGVGYLRSGDLEKAQAAFSTAADLDGAPAAIDGLGCVALRRGNLVIAEKLFLRAIDLDRTYSAAYGNLGLLYDIAGKKDLARHYFEQALEVTPDDPQIRNNFAGTLSDSPSTKDRARMELIQAQVLGAKRIAEANLAVLGRYEGDAEFKAE